MTPENNALFPIVLDTAKRWAKASQNLHSFSREVRRSWLVMHWFNMQALTIGKSASFAAKLYTDGEKRNKSHDELVSILSYYLGALLPYVRQAQQTLVLPQGGSRLDFARELLIPMILEDDWSYRIQDSLHVLSQDSWNDEDFMSIQGLLFDRLLLRMMTHIIGMGHEGYLFDSFHDHIRQSDVDIRNFDEMIQMNRMESESLEEICRSYETDHLIPEQYSPALQTWAEIMGLNQNHILSTYDSPWIAGNQRRGWI